MSDNKEEFYGWNRCPLDVLMLVFQELDEASLALCMTLNQWWRDSVDYFAQHNNKWKELAQASMTNKGAKFRIKSSPAMSWRDLYYNLQLWNNVSEAQIKWGPYSVYSSKDIQVIHLYKDNLLVCSGEKEFNLGGAMFLELQTNCLPICHLLKKDRNRIEDVHESDSRDSNSNSQEESNEFDRIKDKLFNGCPFTKYSIFDENCFYVLDEKNVMRRYSWDEGENKWVHQVLGRYYGCSRAIKDIHVYDGDVYILVKSGHVMRADREGKNFETASVLDFPPQSRMYFVRMMHSRVKLNIEMASVIDVRNGPILGTGVLLNKFSAVISVPAEEEFTVSYQQNSDQFVIQVPELTSALEHGDILFLGYQDGRLDICKPNRLLEEGYVPELSLNILDSYEDLDVIDDPAIVSIEVFEANESHHLFVATCYNVYMLSVTYPDSVKNSIEAVRRQI